GVPSNPEIAVKMLNDLAAKGDQQAYISLADYHLAGEIIPVDVETARGYLEKAIEMGNPAGLVRLGDLYRVGAPGLTADIHRAMEFYNRAVALGVPGGERFLANVYL